MEVMRECRSSWLQSGGEVLLMTASDSPNDSGGSNTGGNKAEPGCMKTLNTPGITRSPLNFQSSLSQFSHLQHDESWSRRKEEREKR